MRDMYEIRDSRVEAARATIEASDIIGKKVIDRSGRKIGKVGAIHINPRSLNVEGIRVDRGLGKKDDFIGKNYIRTLNSEGALLSITPVHDLVGYSVYDARGRKVGEVKKVKRASKTNNLTTVVVGRGVLKRDLVVNSRNIDFVGEDRITLKSIVLE